MYASLSQVATSIERLQEVHPFFGFAFLGFKKAKLPVGSTVEFNYTYIRDNILDRYFRVGDTPNYFNPFRSTTKWLAPRYESTSLQRIIADTFAPAFLHAKGSSKWGWRKSYVQALHDIRGQTKSSRIPTVDLAVWLFRYHDFQEFTAETLVAKFQREFQVTSEEYRALFTSGGDRAVSFDPSPISEVDLLNLIGWPDGAPEKSGVTLEALELTNVGPAAKLSYRPASRINIVTGDNSVGKTFLLDCGWWSLTGEWMDYPADPYAGRRKGRAEINFSLRSATGRVQRFEIPYSPVDSDWQRPPQPFQGLALYSDYSGGAAIWDPTFSDPHSRISQEYIRMKRDAIWEGLFPERMGRRQFIANGLIQDWVDWQRTPNSKIWKAFESCITTLSPSEGPSLKPGPPTRVAGDSREIPTLKMPYGNVPIIYASAGIRRILALGYMLVWTWFRHVEMAKRQGREPLRTMVVVVDEIEAHLHPRWQRQIIPALMNAIQTLQSEVSVQLHISTHSPLVLASVEPLFEVSQDAIHNLQFEGGSVSLSMLTDWKQGSINYWLQSDVFGLGEARSLPAEELLQKAIQVQRKRTVSVSEVNDLHAKLVHLLPDDDPFWPRWISFYEKNTRTRRGGR